MLTPREQLVIRKRYFEDAKHTFEAIGRELGVSKDRVRQLEARALAKLQELLRPALVGLSHLSGRRRSAGIQPASSRERRVAAATARLSSGCKPSSSAISTDSAAAVVPPGLVTLRRSVSADSVRAGEQLAGARDRLAGQSLRQVGRQPGFDSGPRQTLGQQEDVGRTAAGNGGHRVEQALVVDPEHAADRRQQLLAQRLLRARSSRHWRRRR